MCWCLLLGVIAPIALFILPPQAKGNIFVRYYPQYRSEVTKNNFVTPPIVSEKPISKVPDLINGQDRQNFWPRYAYYVLNHPFGMYGPEIIPSQRSQPELNDGEHNTLLQAGRYGGWGALIIIAIYMMRIFRISRHLIKSKPYDDYTIGIIASCIGLFILVMLNSFLHLKTLWIIPALLIALYRKK